jgi:hypothetical protein
MKAGPGVNRGRPGVHRGPGPIGFGRVPFSEHVGFLKDRGSAAESGFDSDHPSPRNAAIGARHQSVRFDSAVCNRAPRRKRIESQAGRAPGHQRRATQPLMVLRRAFDKTLRAGGCHRHRDQQPDRNRFHAELIGPRVAASAQIYPRTSHPTIEHHATLITRRFIYLRLAEPVLNLTRALERPSLRRSNAFE